MDRADSSGRIDEGLNELRALGGQDHSVGPGGTASFRDRTTEVEGAESVARAGAQMIESSRPTLASAPSA